MSKIDLAKGLTLPIEAVTETFAVLGRRGSGKTHTASVLTEELLSRSLQVVVIDPLDVWHGLRSSADGKREGHAIVVFGGPRGDADGMPLAGASGRVLADAIVETGISAVLSLRHLSKTEGRRFVGDFAERLYERKGEAKHRNPLHLVVDEADAFVPQRILPGGEAAYGAIDTLVRRGRSSGVGTTLISQRAAVIAKDVLTQTEVLVCHQTTGPQDRKALEAWIEANDDQGRRGEFMGSLASLKRGEAWFWSPSWLGIFQRVQVRPRRTFDSSATPKVGAVKVEPSKVAQVDLEALRGRLAATIEKAKADDPAELRKQLAAARRELERKVAPAAPAGPLLQPEEREALTELGEHVGALRDAVQPLYDQALSILDLFRQLDARLARLAPAPTRATSSQSRPEVVHRDTGPSPSGLGKGELVILTAVAQHADGVTREQLTVLTGYKRSSRDTYLQRLRQHGHIEDGETLTVTAVGLKALGPDFQPLPTGDALLEHWLGRLPQGERLVLEAVVKAHPKALDRDKLSERTGYKRSSRDTYLQRLGARRLVVLDRDGVRASEELFG
jgi:uncharacterized protein